MKIQNFKKILISVGIILIIAIIFTIVSDKPAFADSGFSASYDDGGNSGSSGGESWTIIPGIIFVVLLIIYSIMNIGKKNDKFIPQQPYMPVQNKIENTIKGYIPDFDKTQFLNYGYKMYCDIQNAYMNFRIENVKKLLTDELYNTYKSQLAMLEKKGEQNITKEIFLNNSYLRDARVQNNTLMVTAGYVMEFYSYTVDRNTEKIVRGTEKRKIKVTGEMQFIHSLNQNDNLDKCPNCGAPIKTNSLGTCQYCRAKIMTEKSEWILASQKILTQENI